ncbi:MAG: lytic murein transglycosylase, partial [Pelistega sp.]|nr:lytic murein transglycosylase [Pelistega sp.]
MKNTSLSRLFIASSTALVLSACASSSSSYETESTIAPSNTQTSTKTGWQVENSPLSADKTHFIKQVAERYNIPESFVQQMLSQANVNERVQDLMSPKKTTAVKRHWQTYRNRFVEPIRTRKGTAFWNAHRADLAAAERQYGVPAAIIAGIIGVETVYGEQMGSFSVLDALYTLGFYHPDPSRPEKSQMFRNQLAALIELTHKGKFDGYTATGSFAGASGLGQFMPISILHYAVDADGNGKIDLRNSTKDAIFSVANFLVKHGWQSNMPVFAPVRLPASP